MCNLHCNILINYKEIPIITKITMEIEIKYVAECNILQYNIHTRVIIGSKTPIISCFINISSQVLIESP